jgi:hypothetical protein
MFPVPIPPYTGENTGSFESWSRRFLDQMEATGSKLSEAQKIAQLKFHLDGLPRVQFEELSSLEKSTLQNVIDALTKIFDSPIRIQLARQKLNHAKQFEDESVDKFANRLYPLINSAHSDKSPRERQEIIKYEFLDKLKPDISFYVRIAQNHSQTFEEIYSKALEIENALSQPKPHYHIQSMTNMEADLDPQDFFPNPEPPNQFPFHQSNYHNNIPLTCWYCEEIGHKRHECPYLEEEMNQNDWTSSQPNAFYPNNSSSSQYLSNYSTEELLEEIKNRCPQN